MDIVATVNQETQQVIEKVEQDDSFKVNEESGVFSNGSNSISTDTNSWIFYENEVMDASVFSLPEYVQSSNIKAERPEADFSSISQEFSHQVLPGNFLYTLMTIFLHEYPYKLLQDNGNPLTLAMVTGLLRELTACLNWKRKETKTMNS